MIADLREFKKYINSTSLQNGTFFIYENIGHFIISDDLSSYLNKTNMWISFNFPFFQLIKRLGGYQYEEKYFQHKIAFLFSVNL